MYEKIEIWKRVGSGLAVRFQCLKRGADGMFAVQNSDYFRSPLGASEGQSSDMRFVELFLDDDPSDRCDWYTSMEEAISHHERDFNGMPGKS